MGIKNNKNSFSLETIKRLSLYLRSLKRLKEQNISIISSRELTEVLNVTPVQFRKDLSYFGGFGKRGVGYKVDRLIREIEGILGVNKKWKIILVGVGKLGSALLGFEGFSKYNIKIVYAFDNDKAKIGKLRSGVKTESITKMKSLVSKNNIEIALISTPPEVAQSVATALVDSGIRCILNFAPRNLKVPKHVVVSTVDMASKLESLIFFAKQNKLSRG